MAIFGFQRYMLYSGTEREFDLMSASELQSNLNLHGSIGKVTYMLHEEKVTSNILGIPVSETTQYYYVLPIENTGNEEDLPCCLIAVSDPDDVAAVERLMEKKGSTSNAPRFEFRGLALDMTNDMYNKFKKYLQGEYGTGLEILDFLSPADVSDKLVPYVIYVKGKYDDNYVLPMAVGGGCFLVGTGLFVLMAVKIYKKRHKYD